MSFSVVTVIRTEKEKRRDRRKKKCKEVGAIREGRPGTAITPYGKSAITPYGKF